MCVCVVCGCLWALPDTNKDDEDDDDISCSNIFASRSDVSPEIILTRFSSVIVRALLRSHFFLSVLLIFGTV